MTGAAQVKIIKHLINMTISKRPHLLLVSILAFAFSWCMPTAMGLSIAVPEVKELVAKAELILVVEIKAKEAKIEADVKEVLKGYNDLQGKTIGVLSPFPELSVPMKKWFNESEGMPVILVGKYIKESNAIELIYGPASFWPRGAPIDVSKAKTMEECLDTIKKHASKQMIIERSILKHEGTPVVTTPSVVTPAPPATNLMPPVTQQAAAIPSTPSTVIVAQPSGFNPVSITVALGVVLLIILVVIFGNKAQGRP